MTQFLHIERRADEEYNVYMDNVIISISGSDGENKIELITNGTLTSECGRVVLEYDETELSGIQGTKTRIFIDGDAVSMQRSGTSDTFMHFAKNMSSISTLGEGAFSFSIFTHHLKFEQDNSGGDLDIRYTMEIFGESAQNRVWLNYKLRQ